MTNRTIDGLLLVEDDLQLRSSLALQLAERVTAGKLWQCASMAEARALQRSQHPEFVLLDVGLPDGNGLQLLVDQHELKNPAKVVILSGLSDEETIVRAIGLGAAGYLLKQETANALAALDQILAGQPPLSPSVAQCIMGHIRSETQPSENPSTGYGMNLPPRQFATLKLLARGLTYQQIAQQMEISFHTVSAYAQEIYTKLSVRSRGEAVHRARELGIL